MKNYCLNCMEEKSEGNICPHCGFDENNYEHSAHHLPMGTVLAGKYLVGKVLGEGGFGITYMGIDLNLEIKMAIKEYYPNGFVTRENNTTVFSYKGEKGEFFISGKEKFLDEAKTLAKFRTKPGVVSVSDFFAENSTAYIVMEYIDGMTFKSYLSKMGGKLPSEQVFEMMKPVIRTLGEIHSVGMIHRDISPDNLMISHSGDVKLLDFGAARNFTQAGNKSLSVMLKPGYAPEEQYRSRGIQGPWTDIYALCATMYKCITGITPDEASERMVSDTIRPSSQFGEYIDPVKESAIMRGLSVKQNFRQQNIDELNRELYDRIPHALELQQNTQSMPVKDVEVLNQGTKNTNTKTIMIAVVSAVLLIAFIAILVPILNRGDESVSSELSNSEIESEVSGQVSKDESKEITEVGDIFIISEDEGVEIDMGYLYDEITKQAEALNYNILSISSSTERGILETWENVEYELMVASVVLITSDERLEKHIQDSGNTYAVIGDYGNGYKAYGISGISSSDEEKVEALKEIFSTITLNIETTPVLSHEEEAELAMYQTYNSIITDYETTYGAFTSEPFNENQLLKGVSFIDLIDFNSDGVDELLLVYAPADKTMSELMSFSDAYFMNNNCVDIWGIDENGEISKIWTQQLMVYGNGGIDYSLELIYSDVVYLGAGHELSSMSYSSYIDNGFEVVRTYDTVYSADNLGGDNFINGEPIDSTVFYNDYKTFTENSKIFCITYATKSEAEDIKRITDETKEFIELKIR